MGWRGAARGGLRSRIPRGAGQPALSSASARSRHTWPAGSRRLGTFPSLERAAGGSSAWGPRGLEAWFREGRRQEPWTQARGPAGEGPPAPRPRRRRSLRRPFGRFCWRWEVAPAPGTLRPGPDPSPSQGHGDGDGRGVGPIPPRPEAPGRSARPDSQPQLPAGDGARPPGSAGLEEPRATPVS